MHRQSFLKLMDESDFFGLVKPSAKVNSSVGIAVFYLMTTPTILEELGVLWKLSLLELYLSETYLKKIRADLSVEGKQIIDAAISFLSKGKQLNRMRCLEEWGSLKNKRIRSALIQALSIVLDEVVLESENRMGVETSSSRTANQLKRVLTFNQIKFLDNHHRDNFYELIHSIESTIDENLEYANEQFDPVIYILSVPKLNDQFGFLTSVEALISFFEFEEWIDFNESVTPDAYQLLLLASHLWDSVFPFDINEFIRVMIGLEDLVVLKEAIKLKKALIGTNDVFGNI
jgi:hypothetical protein